jgi:microcystin-dependent protein
MPGSLLSNAIMAALHSGIPTIPNTDVAGKMALLADTIADYLDPPGTPHEFAGSVVPAGWLLCNGQAVSRATYPKVFAALGIVWGAGNGSTTFNLPDLVGAAPAGVGTSTGYTQNETIALGTKYNDQIQGHRHAPLAEGNFVKSTGNNAAGGSGVSVATTDVTTGDPVTDTVNGTPRTGTVTRGKRVGVNFIIRAV